MGGHHMRRAAAGNAGASGEGYRYFRIVLNDSWHDIFQVTNLRFSEDGGSTTFPPDLTDYDAPSPWEVSTNSEDIIADVREAWMACDSSSTSRWRTTSDNNTYFQIDAGAGASLLPNYLLMRHINNNAAASSSPKEVTVLASNTGDFSGEDVTLYAETGLAEIGSGGNDVTYTW